LGSSTASYVSTLNESFSSFCDPLVFFFIVIVS
jgi:hypothetical protein